MTIESRQLLIDDTCIATPSQRGVFYIPSGSEAVMPWQCRGNEDRCARRQPALHPGVQDPSGPEIADRGPQQRETPLSSERGAGGADGT